MKLQIERQQLDDLSTYFLPFMLKVIDSQLLQNKGTDLEFSNKVLKSILSDVDLIFKRKVLCRQRKFQITFKEAEGLVLMYFLLRFPIPADHWYRLNLRNQLVEQLHKQTV